MTEKFNYTDKDELRELFAQFQPEMTSETEFISKLETRLAAIEDVRELNKSQYRRMKKAVGIAAAFGFIVGVVLTLSFPLIVSGISSLMNAVLPSISGASTTIVWIVISIATGASALAAYDLSLSPAIQTKIK